MATITASWTENQSLQAAQTLNAAASDTDDIDIATAGYDAVLVQWIGTFNASATAGATIEVFGSPDSGTNEDSIPLLSIPVAVSAGNTVKVSFTLEGVPYAAIKRTNVDATYAITNETVLYAGRKWASA